MFDVLTHYMAEYLPILRWQDIIDILAVAFIIYRVILLIRGTRAMQTMAGLAIVVVIYFVAGKFQLQTLHWLLGAVLGSIFILIIILFQDDIRRALIQMGQSPFLKTKVKAFNALEEIAKTAAYLSEEKTGALIVIEKDVGLSEYISSGIKLDAETSRYLLSTIFYKGTILHDGAVIIQNGRIAAAACVLPLTTNPDISRRLGTRHRAAIGITEQTDAVSVIVSEETGAISVAIGGKITRDIDPGTLRRILHNTFMVENEPDAWWKRFQKR
ncbi:MAG: diadenylate cyclase CdaA [Deltaproteobacteria bacterium]|nr:diadenylate cyclase CdaA [Deltaproteobacteria bacterium]